MAFLEGSKKETVNELFLKWYEIVSGEVCRKLQVVTLQRLIVIGLKSGLTSVYFAKLALMGFHAILRKLFTHC